MAPALRGLSATTLFLTLLGVYQFASTLVFTANIVFQVEDANLTPLELVLVGTVWEATYIVFEVPTGIVADLYSRRLSVLIGLAISAAGLALVGAYPAFGVIALGYVVLGVGGTFVSGAQEAWVADEVGAARAGDVFLRGSQYARTGTLAAIPLAAALGSIDLQLPMFAGAALTLALCAFLAATMPETGFRRPAAEDWRGGPPALQTLMGARELVRRRPVLLTVLAVAAVFGAASEGFDRLSTPHFLRDAGLPAAGHLDPVVWFSVITGLQTLISIVVVQRVRWSIDTTDPRALARALMAADLIRTVGVVAFAFSGSFVMALAVYLPTRAFALVHYPLYQAWINLSLESNVRATMLSVSSQADAIGQVTAGPAVGLLANAVDIRAGLLAAGVALLPVLPLYGKAVGQGHGVLVEEVIVEAAP